MPVLSTPRKPRSSRLQMGGFCDKPGDPCTPMKTHSSGLQVGGFCEKPEDHRNEEDLCKISPLNCQGTKITISYQH